MIQVQEQKQEQPRLSFEPPISGRIEALRKMRSFYLQSLAEAANEIKAIDCEIEALNMKNLGDDGL